MLGHQQCEVRDVFLSAFTSMYTVITSSDTGLYFVCGLTTRVTHFTIHMARVSVVFQQIQAAQAFHLEWKSLLSCWPIGRNLLKHRHCLPALSNLLLLCKPAQSWRCIPVTCQAM